MHRSLFLIKLQAWRSATSLKRDFNTVAFTWISQNFKNTYFKEHLRTAASQIRTSNNGPGWMWLNAILLANHPAKKTIHISSMVFHILEKLTCKLHPANFNHCPKFDLQLSVFGKIRGYIFYKSLKISKYCQ